MHILITGGAGQLGNELVNKLGSHFVVTALSKNELDVTDHKMIHECMKQYKPDLIIHTAAFTAVDQCEIDRKKAFEINGIGAGLVANEASKIGARMFYISSDYVFNGEKRIPYEEHDSPDPKSVYGMSKWMGEKVVQAILPECTIIRTSWLYGHKGENFVKTMLNVAKMKTEIKVVNDQVGSPTYTADLVNVIEQLLYKKSGIYHVSNTSACTWYEFSRTIFELAGYNPNFIKPISTEDYRALAPRPSYSVMNHTAIKKVGIPIPRSWDKALEAFIRKEKEHD